MANRVMTDATPRRLLPMLAMAAMVAAATCVAQPAAEPLPLPPVTESPATAAATDVIVEVRIEGNHATDVSKLPKLVTRAGQIFDAQAIEEDVRTLHRSRKFVDVHPKYGSSSTSIPNTSAWPRESWSSFRWSSGRCSAT